MTDLFDNIFPKNIVTVNKNLHFLIMTINDSFSIIFSGSDAGLIIIFKFTLNLLVFEQ